MNTITLYNNGVIRLFHSDSYHVSDRVYRREHEVYDSVYNK
jgi:hypothetical protein